MTHQVDDFHKLERRICLSGTLITRTALRVGSGGNGELEAVDLPVIRDGHGYPLIPGSSLKGVLRSTVEALLRGAGLPRHTGLWTCDPLKDDQSPEDRACGFHSEGERQKVKTTNHCAVCYLFGSHVVASHVRMSDALMPREDRNGRIPIEIRDGVAIDRDLRTAATGQKYNFEVVSPGTRFDLEVFIENPQDWLMGLLVVGFEQIAEGFSALGGFTSRGLGRMGLKWTGMTQVTARELLAGGTPVRFDEEARTAYFAECRAKLAAKSGAAGGM